MPGKDYQFREGSIIDNREMFPSWEEFWFYKGKIIRERLKLWMFLNLKNEKVFLVRTNFLYWEWINSWKKFPRQWGNETKWLAKMLIIIIYWDWITGHNMIFCCVGSKTIKKMQIRPSDIYKCHHWIIMRKII